MNDKPIPLKVFGRSHYACQRCKISKMRCSGEKPACTNCINSNKQHQCVYPAKDRKIMLMESDLNKLHERVSYLESLLRQKGELRQAPHAQSLPPAISNIASSLVPAIPPMSLPSPITLLSPIQPRVHPRVNKGLFDFILEDFLLPDRYNESLQWHLNLWNRPLPPKEHTLLLLDTVQRRYSLEFYLIDFPEVNSLIDRVYADFDNPYVLLQLVNHVSLCYFFVILAFGAQQLTPPPQPQQYGLAKDARTPTSIPGMEYYIIASQLFNIAQEELDIHFVQAAVLLGLYAANLNRYNTVYNYFGVASRASVAMGLHRQVHESSATGDTNEEFLIKAEKYKRLWWTVFIIDTTWAAKMNLPVHIDYTDTDVDLPLDNFFDLRDQFDSRSLDSNVQLSKYISRFGRIIYGPKIRTFSVNYINTDQFNQRLLIKNITNCLKDLTVNLELTILAQYNKSDIVQVSSRRLTNLFLRFYQLIGVITMPLVSMLFDNHTSAFIDNGLEEINQALSKGLFASAASIDLVYTLYQNNLMFEVGFWDSQYTFSSLMILTMSQVLGGHYPQLQKGIALLNHMCERGNINARNSVVKLRQIFALMGEQLDVARNFSGLDLDMNLSTYETQHQYRRDVRLSPNIDLVKFLSIQQCDEDSTAKAKAEVDKLYQSASEQDIETFQDFFLGHSWLSEPIWREIQQKTQLRPLVLTATAPTGEQTRTDANGVNDVVLKDKMYSIIRRVQGSEEADASI